MDTSDLYHTQGIADFNLKFTLFLRFFEITTVSRLFSIVFLSGLVVFFRGKRNGEGLAAWVFWPVPDYPGDLRYAQKLPRTPQSTFFKSKTPERHYYTVVNGASQSPNADFSPAPPSHMIVRQRIEEKGRLSANPPG